MNRKFFLMALGALSFTLVGISTFFGCQAVQTQPPTSLPQQNAAPFKQTVQAARLAATSQSVRFIAFGDPGSGAKQQYDMADRMIAFYDKHPYAAAIVLGDNIYPDGDIAQFGETRFNQPYRPLREERRVPFLVALGNHDVLRGQLDKQVAFYKMPNRYYQKMLGKPVGNQDLVNIFVLDTNTFANDQTQKTWLKEQLGKSQAIWKIVAGHHPIHSSGKHGDNKELQKTLTPLLQAYKVQLYLAGHDHDYERFSSVGGVTEVVSGGAGAYLRQFDEPKPNSIKRESVFHFLSLEATPTQLRIDGINRQGQLFDSVSLKK